MTYLPIQAPAVTTMMSMDLPREDPRARMAARLPASLQPMLTWITAKPAPDEAAPKRTGAGFVVEALCWIAVGLVLNLLPFAVAVPLPLAAALVLVGLTATSSGLGLFQVVVFHHASHGTVFKAREHNRTAGRLVSALLLFKRFEDYQREHMLHHSANKLLTDEDEFTGFVFGICKLEPGVAKRELWRRVLVNLVSPRFHVRFMVKRVRGSMFTGDRAHDWTARGAYAAMLALAAATGTLAEFALAWLLPVTVLLQVATVFRILCEHRFPDVALIEARGKAFVCASTTGVFPGKAPPEVSAASIGGALAWAGWWATMLTGALFARVFVMVGDAPCHDFHHRRPATRKWTAYAHARQQDSDAGSPGFPVNYTENWGVLRAVDANLATLTATPPGAVH